MSDEQNPEIVDIGLPPMAEPPTTGTLRQMCNGLIKVDPVKRVMAFELLEFREAKT